MREKERYKIDKSTNYYTNTIVDTETNAYYGNIEEHIDLLNQQSDRIKELEEELAKQKEKYDYLYGCYKKTSSEDLQDKYRLAEENQQLKQQLAEKDKELSEYVKIVDDLHKQLSDKCDFCDKTKDQDKISFAIAELEKVKEFFLEEHRDEEMDTDYIITKDVGEIADYLLDQIKQLKEMR